MIGTANLRIACWYDASGSDYVQMPGCRAFRIIQLKGPSTWIILAQLLLPLSIAYPLLRPQPRYARLTSDSKSVTIYNPFPHVT